MSSHSGREPGPFDKYLAASLKEWVERVVPPHPQDGKLLLLRSAALAASQDRGIRRYLKSMTRGLLWALGLFTLEPAYSDVPTKYGLTELLRSRFSYSTRVATLLLYKDNVGMYPGGAGIFCLIT